MVAMERARDPLLTFPCRFPIKVMGPADEGFDARVVAIVRRYVPPLGEGAVSQRLSRGGRYVAVTVTVEAESREQLDSIYRALTADERVLMAL
jgi:hypothetical protein